MAKNSEEDDTKRHDYDSSEDEPLSLCDLPLDLTDDEEGQLWKDRETPDTEEEFEFGSWVGSVLTEKEMCAADELFFEGQILPLRLSTRSASGSGSTSISSRSSSLNSNSTTSSASMTSHTNTTSPRKHEARNQFHTHPSPKPQIRAPGRSRPNASNRKSSVWDLFRVGLVPTPEIGLQDLKVRSNNKNFGIGLEQRTKNIELKTNKGEEDKRMRRDRKSSNRGLLRLRGCKCSVETVSLEVKSTTRSSRKGKGNSNESTRRAMQQKQRQEEKRTIIKQATSSRHRTSEWVKEVSHESCGDGDHETVALLA